MTTPAAAPAAPAAAPAAPAAAPAVPAAPAAPPAAPAAPAPSPAPAAAPTPPPAADPGDSLLPADPAAAPAPAETLTPEQQLAAARKLIADAEAAADPNGGKAWLLHEGVMGQGAKPEWFKADKYKTVAEQAKAYPELEKRLGGFVGAPKDGYKFTPPEGIEVSMDHPVMQEFTKWAASKQLSQEGYTELLGMLVQYEAAQAPDMGSIKGRLGENADSRIAAVAAWGKANLGPEGYATLRAATSGANADAVFKVLEQVIGKTGQVRMPKPGEDVSGAQPGAGLQAIQAKLAEKMPDGRRKVDAVPGYRAQIEKEMRDYFAQFPAGTQYQPDGWKSI